jgi:hypothetical protein
MRGELSATSHGREQYPDLTGGVASNVHERPAASNHPPNS